MSCWAGGWVGGWVGGLRVGGWQAFRIVPVFADDKNHRAQATDWGPIASRDELEEGSVGGWVGGWVGGLWLER